jgi:hypothetical protein
MQLAVILEISAVAPVGLGDEGHHLAAGDALSVWAP